MSTISNMPVKRIASSLPCRRRSITECRCIRRCPPAVIVDPTMGIEPHLVEGCSSRSPGACPPFSEASDFQERLGVRGAAWCRRLGRGQAFVEAETTEANKKKHSDQAGSQNAYSQNEPEYAALRSFQIVCHWSANYNDCSGVVRRQLRRPSRRAYQEKELSSTKGGAEREGRGRKKAIRQSRVRDKAEVALSRG
jgi:hypothetical protein